MYKRTQTKPVFVDKLQIGGQNHIIIQSMTNTKTSNVLETIKQIQQLKDIGCELVRIAILDDDDANAVKDIVKLSPLPIVCDIHFNFEFAIKSIKSGVKKIRLNPGNLDNPIQLREICALANRHNVVIRIGVNSGSLPNWASKKFGHTPLAMIETAKHYIKLLNSENFDNLVISLKASDPLMMIQAYELACQTFNYPLHLGVTEAGVLLDATIKSTIGLTPLLMKGIGDTIRISITDNPTHEIEVARKLLNYLNLRNDLIDIISCPTCGRLEYNMFELIEQIKDYTKNIFIPIRISILGCVVNGIGEGKESDIGVAGGKNKAIIFKKGAIYKVVHPNEIFDEIKLLIDEFISNN